MVVVCLYFDIFLWLWNQFVNLSKHFVYFSCILALLKKNYKQSLRTETLVRLPLVSVGLFSLCSFNNQINLLPNQIWINPVSFLASLTLLNCVSHDAVLRSARVNAASKPDRTSHSCILFFLGRWSYHRKANPFSHFSFFFWETHRWHGGFDLGRWSQIHQESESLVG